MVKAATGKKKYQRRDPKPSPNVAAPKETAKSFLESLLEKSSSLLQAAGFELVKAECPFEEGRYVFRLFVDRLWNLGDPEGELITLDDCAEVSRILDEVLAELDESPVGQKLSDYSLEVSSPGLDRPLVQEKDYFRFKGRLVKLKLRRDGKSSGHKGRLGVEEGAFSCLEADGQVVEFELDDVTSCRLSLDEVEF